MTNLKEVLKSIEDSSKDYDFSLHVGDLVDEASKFTQLDTVANTLSMYANSSETDLILALGNHEYMGDKDGKTARTFFNTPLNGPAENLGACYSTEYGNVYVAVIGFTVDPNLLKTQLDWLKADAAKTNKTWKILLTHQPVFYSNPEGGNGLFKEMLPKVADEIGIDFVFSGHDHAYGRTKSLKNGVEDPQGTTYIISGS
ncbi:metallophosphoesterase, partial [Cutibacterium acnes]